MRRISASRFYVISDLHLVGRQAIEHFDCADELQEMIFRIDVEAGPNAVLLLLGDIFDFWQMNGSPVEMIRDIHEAHLRLFQALRDFADRRRVILIPGNHDRDIIYSEDVRKLLSEYGIETEMDAPVLLETSEGAPLAVAEHGHDIDPYNRYEHGQTVAEKPFGEHIMRLFINPVKALNINDKQPWMTDIDFVNPIGAIPWWMASKFFYNEAAWWLKALWVPSALLFSFTKIGLVLVGLNYLGVDLRAYGLPKIPVPFQYALLGLLGIDAFMLILLALGWVLKQDALRALKRWGVEDLEDIIEERTRDAERRARRVLDESGARLYVFGHTHDAFLKFLPEHLAWCNTGTWMKRMRSIPARGYLPSVYVPSYKLTYMVLKGKGDALHVELRQCRKPPPKELTWLERASIFGRKLPRVPEHEEIVVEQLVVRNQTV